MASNSLLTGKMREYLRGEHEYDRADSENRMRNRMRERIALGMLDLSLLAEHSEKVDPVKSLIRFSRDRSKPEGGSSTRQEWRQATARESIPAALSFLMELANGFNYTPADWEEWLEKAYEQSNPNGYASVSFETIPELDLDKLEAVYEGHHNRRSKEELRDVELRALYDHGRISLEEYVEAGGQVQVK